MTDLERFRDHARTMADATHRPNCTGIRDGRWGPLAVHPHPDCAGCIPDDERRLWEQIAGEIDQHLANTTGEPQIWNRPSSGYDTQDATLEGTA